MVKIKHKDFSYALSKLIVDKGTEDLWSRENPDSCEFTRCDRFFGKDPGYRVYRVYTDVKIANNNKINHIMVSFSDIFNAISIDRLSSKTKIVKDSWKRFLKIILLCKPEFSSATKTSFLLKTQKTTTLQQVTGGNTPNIVLKRMQRYFLKTPPLKI